MLRCALLPLIALVAFVLYNAWSIGANDETMAPVVSGRSLDVKTAVVMGSVVGVLGSVFLGENVQKCIGSDLLFQSMTLECALIVLLCSSVWLTAVSYRGYSVSTTHSTLSALVGYGLIVIGTSGVNWLKVAGIVEGLTKESLSPKYREDLMHIVKRLDVIADQVKDSARNVKILLGTDVPEEIWSVNVKIAEALAKESDLLGSTLEMLGIAPAEAKELARKVDDQENIVDAEYLRAKALFSKYSKKMDFAMMLILKDLLDRMEQIADLCSDTADYIKILAVGR